MKIEKYELTTESSFTVFEFTSEGSKGKIRKLIEFQQTDQPDLYNLAFGDKNIQTRKINDQSISGNGDTGKVLATVISSLYAFFDKHPGAFVFAVSNSHIRMRLYRMAITRFYKEITQNFDVYGQTGETFLEFESGKDYTSFLIQRKFV